MLFIRGPRLTTMVCRPCCTCSPERLCLTATPAGENLPPMTTESENRDDDTLSVSLHLRMGEASREVSLTAPTRPVTAVELLPVIQAFDSDVVSLAEDASQQSGKTISCRAGCGACCRQLVPLSETEASFLAGLVAGMPRDRRRKIERRFSKALAALAKAGLLEGLDEAWRTTSEAEQEQLSLDYFHLGIPCPFLEDESCGIHLDRPLACREFLVTSPAENCSDPSPDNIEVVPLPGKPSRVLYQFGDGRGNGPRAWMPLTLALGWASQNPAGEDTPRRPGHEMLLDFLGKMQS